MLGQLQSFSPQRWRRFPHRSGGDVGDAGFGEGWFVGGDFGSGFGSATPVTFGGVAATFRVVSGSRIDAVVPSGLAPGVVDVVVTVSGVSSSPSAADRFTVVAPPPPGLPAKPGYHLVGADGGVFAFGDARYLGSLPGLGLKVSDVVGMAATPDGGGYWLVAADGGVFAFGDAGFYGSMAGVALHRPVVGMDRPETVRRT